jgi:Prolyl oligopeptidase family
MISDWGNVVFGDSFDSYYFGKSPMEDPELYIRKSPFFKMDKVKALVLIFHGTADTNVPPARSWSFFRALQYYDQVPVRFVVFPGEPHGPHKLTHQLRKVEEEVAWFDKYFFKTTQPGNEALKKDSALSEAMRLRKPAVISAFHSYGIQRGQIVLPETVRRGDLQIGRFEVTTAQYVDFLAERAKKGTRKGTATFYPPPGALEHTVNLPASGVTVEDAKE